jgi:5-hydroxyisourate hydrolase
MPRLSTHVLDTSRGLPAAGIPVELHFIVDGGQRRLMATAVTNADGRTDAPLLAVERLDVGVYELTFHVRDYLTRSGAVLTEPPFLGDILVRVGIADAAGSYHVPLLLSPHGYSVYRGS